MQINIELPKAFSVRDDRELLMIQGLMSRLNPSVLVAQVATGLHVNGGSTVNWGLVYLDGEPPVEQDVQSALREAGLDFEHNAAIDAPQILTNVNQT